MTAQDVQAIGTVSLALVVSNRCQSRCLSSCPVGESTFHDCKHSLPDAFQCTTQPNTILLDCLPYLMLYFCDPGILPRSAS